MSGVDVMLATYATLFASFGVAFLAMRLVGYYWRRWREKESKQEMSQYGIRLPAPKLDMPPDDARNHARYITQLIAGHVPSRYASSNEFERDLFGKMEVWHRHWRIERSRADDLERMVEQLEMENRRLRKPRILSLFKRKQ